MAIPRSTVRFVTAVVVLLIGGVSAALWTDHSALVGLQSTVDHVKSDVEYLKLYGPGTGPRFTARDGEKHDERITDLEDWQIEHIKWGREVSGKWNALHSEAFRRLDKFEGYVINAEKTEGQ